MDIERFCLKFFARPGPTVDDAIFINVFHEWIRFQKLGGILLDVADYRHVPEGPGIMLITHEINFAMDYGEGRFGLFAQRKLGPGLNHQARILELVRSTVAFGALLETEPRLSGRLSLEGGAFHYMSNDRLLAPNTGGAFAALQPDLVTAAAIIYPGQDISITRVENDPRDRLTAAIETSVSINLSALLETTGVIV
jgi:hypothetical protein